MDNVFKIASIRSAIYNVNVRSEPRLSQTILHFTQATYRLLERLRDNKPKIVNGKIKVNKLIKANGTYFTDQEQEEYYYELEHHFVWMRDQEDKEKRM